MADESKHKETGKFRAQRIRLDYHKQRGWMYWSRWWLSVPGLLLTVIYSGLVISDVFRQDAPATSNRNSWASHISTGGISSVHAHFENECYKCHDEQFATAISSDAPDVMNLFGQKVGRDHLALEQKCIHCHEVGPHIVPTVSSDSQVACAELAMDHQCAICHKEHQGKSQDLRNITSKLCISCHGDLSASCASSPLNQRVDRFSVATHAVEKNEASDDGSTFRSLAEFSQPEFNRIKFDHAQHMLPGQVEEGAAGGFLAKNLPPRWKSKYKSTKAGSDDAIVQLQCDSCHEPEASGELYQPIDFEKHCVACHQLNYIGQTQDNLQFPHAAPRDELRTLLAAKIDGGKTTGKIRSYSAPAVEGLSSKEIEPLKNSKSVNMSSESGLKARLAAIEAAVEDTFSLCSKCHVDEVSKDQTFQALLQRTEPLIPQMWLKRGQFNHQSHTYVDCQYCHQTSMRERGDLGPQDHNLLMIEGPRSCVGCHRHDLSEISDAKLEFTKLGAKIQVAFDKEGLFVGGNAVHQPNKVKADCTLCHDYHSQSHVK